MLQRSRTSLRKEVVMNANPFDLSGKTALVTGSSRGIGKAVAFLLGRSGAHVIFHGVEMGDALKKTLEEAVAERISCSAVTGDLGDAASAAKIAADCGGKVDILVLNASVQQYMHLRDFDAAEFEREINANLRSAYLLMQQFLPPMQARKWGRVINVGSVNQMRPAARLSVYSVTKAALQNLMENGAKEYAADGITFNSIVPGIICTDRNRKILADPEWIPKLQAMVPAGRFGTPDDCAGAVLLLASEAGSYITGAEIPIAGGMQL